MRNAPEGWIALLLCRARVLERTWGGNGVPGGTFYTCLPVEKKSILQDINRGLADPRRDQNGAFETAQMFGACSYFKALCCAIVYSLSEVTQREIAWSQKIQLKRFPPPAVLRTCGSHLLTSILIWLDYLWCNVPFLRCDWSMLSFFFSPMNTDFYLSNTRLLAQAAANHPF